MMTTANPRRRAGQRISSAVWGLLVTGAGGLMIASYSGYEIDLELAAISVLGAIGAWLLLSALVSGIGRKREVARATAQTVEERVTPAEHDAGAELSDTDDVDTGTAAGEPDDLTPNEQSPERERET